MGRGIEFKMRYEFEWDEEKADANEQKHGIAFETAMAAFRDPLAISMFDESHSEDEECEQYEEG